MEERMSSYHLKLGFWTEMSPPGSEKCSFRTCFCTETIKYVNRCAAYRKENAVISEHVQCILMSTYGKLHIEASAIWVNASLPGLLFASRIQEFTLVLVFGEGTTWRSRCSHLKKKKKNTQLISLVTIHDKTSPQWSPAWCYCSKSCSKLWSFLHRWFSHNVKTNMGLKDVWRCSKHGCCERRAAGKFLSISQQQVPLLICKLFTSIWEVCLSTITPTDH